MAADDFASTLADEIWAAPQFQQDLAELTRRAVAQSIGRHLPPIDAAALTRLVRSAPTLALSQRVEIGEASYRIAASAYSLAAEQYSGLEPLLSLVLGRRGNFPAVDLRLAGAEERLPPSLLAEASIRRADNTVKIGDQERTLTDFQMLVWRDLRAGKSVAVSAPTSAGKSYVFRAYLEAAAPTQKHMVALVVVPTRALINQMQDQLRRPLERLGGRVVSIPRPQDVSDSPLCYVLTQERLEVLLEAAPEFAPNLILVDEAQSVGDDGRGVILQSVVDELLVRDPKAQVLFTLPISSDAARLGRLFEVPSFVERTTLESPVGQTVVLLSVDSVKSDTVTASVWRPGDNIKIDELKVGSQLTTPIHRLAHLAHEFGRHAPSIVYADTQSWPDPIG